MSLLQLPPEIRLMIYDLVFEITPEVFITRAKTASGCRLSLLQTCRLLYRECTKIAIRNSICRISFLAKATWNFTDKRAVREDMCTMLRRKIPFAPGSPDLSCVTHLSDSGYAVLALLWVDAPKGCITMLLEISSILPQVTHAIVRDANIVFSWVADELATHFLHMRVIIVIAKFANKWRRFNSPGPVRRERNLESIYRSRTRTERLALEERIEEKRLAKRRSGSNEVPRVWSNGELYWFHEDHSIPGRWLEYQTICCFVIPSSAYHFRHIKEFVEIPETEKRYVHAHCCVEDEALERIRTPWRNAFPW